MTSSGERMHVCAVVAASHIANAGYFQRSHQRLYLALQSVTDSPEEPPTSKAFELTKRSTTPIPY